MKLYSPEEVQAMFPDNRRPSLKRLIAKAKEAGCCCKLGRGIGFTPEQVQTFLGYLTCSVSKSTRNARPTTSSPGRLEGSAYLRARELLTGALPNNTASNGNGIFSEQIRHKWPALFPFRHIMEYKSLQKVGRQ